MLLTMNTRLVELEIENSEVELEIEDVEEKLVTLPTKRDLQDHMRTLWSRMNEPGDALYAGDFDQ
jgi:uncharacterized coiled-coil protein SlyX